MGLIENPTVDGFALRQVAIILASEKTISISAYNPLDIPKRYQRWKGLPFRLRKIAYPPFTLKNRPSMMEIGG